MVTLILFVLLILGFLIGLKRGFILQVLHITGFLIAFIIALVYFNDLAANLELWIPFPDMTDQHFWDSVNLEGAFYHGIAFFAIFFVVKIIMQIVANLLDFVAHLPILHSVNNLLGGILGFIEMYVILFVILFFASLIPVELVQGLLDQSSLAGFIIEKTPVFSEQLKEKWFTNLN
ncbi:CvpA family protein [Aquisalibacillus elongatus]|uniref:Putative membrane protein required for colicin V production n=1 Tax=Aquisalibacillus elongatus TaxID=485577 RepID=A0A3N5C7H3_9BACI|nr:CvpA family protein [Aquisalibacillus elongatus]RPF55422.1 putative membrane protein required for colicin V production [Aquisalibacillus elongatus]